MRSRRCYDSDIESAAQVANVIGLNMRRWHHVDDAEAIHCYQHSTRHYDNVTTWLPGTKEILAAGYYVGDVIGAFVTFGRHIGRYLCYRFTIDDDASIIRHGILRSTPCYARRGTVNIFIDHAMSATVPSFRRTAMAGASRRGTCLTFSTADMGLLAAMGDADTYYGSWRENNGVYGEHDADYR